MATAKEFFDLWTRDRQLREPGPRHPRPRINARGYNRTRRVAAFRAIRRQSLKSAQAQQPA